jgi:Rap1a immunity proteins
MRLSSLALCATALSATVAVTSAQAALTRDQFPPRTTSDLIALCSASKDDPLMTAAVNFCQGFAEGAVEMALSYEAMGRKDRQPFCLPTPRPTHDQALAQLVAWANADPKRLDDTPVVGLIRFLIQQYPCPRPAVKHPAAK